MKSFKIIVRNYKTKKGVEFTKMTAKGQYIPLVTADPEVVYTIKFVGDTASPKTEGIYSICCENNDLWIDSRPDYADKNILRVRVVRYIYEDKLPARKENPSNENPF